jgi:hypothetical protein
MTNIHKLIRNLREAVDQLYALADAIKNTADEVEKIASDMAIDVIIDTVDETMHAAIAGSKPIPEIIGADKDGEGGTETGSFTMEELADE